MVLFLEDNEDADDEDDDAPELNTFWVEKSVLLDTIAKSNVKAALEQDSTGGPPQ